MSDFIPGCTWRHDGALDRRLEIGETVAGDDVIEVAMRGIADGLRLAVSPDQADEIADSLKARAALMRGAQ